ARRRKSTTLFAWWSSGATLTHASGFAPWVVGGLPSCLTSSNRLVKPPLDCSAGSLTSRLARPQWYVFPRFLFLIYARPVQVTQVLRRLSSKVSSHHSRRVCLNCRECGS